MTANDPEKNMPSTAAKATNRVGNEEESSIQRRAHTAFRLHSRMFIDGAKQGDALGGLVDVHVDKSAVYFGMDVFHHSLECVEISSLRCLDFFAESSNKILVDDGIGGCKEREHCGYNVSFILRQTLVPVRKIFREVYLCCCPKCGFRFVRAMFVGCKNTCLTSSYSMGKS